MSLVRDSCNKTSVSIKKRLFYILISLSLLFLLCNNIVGLKRFHQLTNDVMEELGKASSITEREKRTTIGLRNKVENEMENQQLHDLYMQRVFQQKEEELARYRAQYESLLQVQAEQRLHMELLEDA